MIIIGSGCVRFISTLRPIRSDAFGGFVRLKPSDTSKNKSYEQELRIVIGSARRIRHLRPGFMIVSVVLAGPGCGS